MMIKVNTQQLEMDERCPDFGHWERPPNPASSLSFLLRHQASGIRLRMKLRRTKSGIYIKASVPPIPTNAPKMLATASRNS